jgi:hypothetical protein
MDFYMYLSSQDKYRGDAQHFIIQTNKLPLAGEWMVALAELYTDRPITNTTILCTNIIEHSSWGNCEEPILRRFCKGKNFTFYPEQFHKLSTNNIGTIAFYFIADNIPFKCVDITLHFKWIGGVAGTQSSTQIPLN